MIRQDHAQDIEILLSHRYDNGGDLWATKDHRLLKGAPFSTLECASYLVELSIPNNDPLMKDIAKLIFNTWRADGRFQIYPTGGIYPCHSAMAVECLCKMGYVKDERILKTLRYFLDTQQEDGGWKCNKYSYGRGAETEYSNPYPTLCVLNAFRFSHYANEEPALDRAVEFLLAHWTIRKPIGPCHYGIGSLFMQVEYPFRGYNLFAYVYVLSFYDYAKKDPRFLEAMKALSDKLVEGSIIVERVVPKLSKLTFCAKGKASILATKRYQEILENLSEA